MRVLSITDLVTLKIGVGAMAEIDVTGFSGANNVKTEERFYSKGKTAEPRVILNADVDVTGQLISRVGKTLYLTLAGGHSLWSGISCMLCVAEETLYRIVDGTKVSIGTISGPKYPLSYVDADDKVYISNKYWQGIFDPATNGLSSWGVDPPPGPMLLSSSGSLPAGTYHVTMTNVTSGELSGNGPISSISLTSSGNIQILNRPSGAIVWITDVNESIFYRVGEVNEVAVIPSIEPLPSFLCSPPPYLDNLCYAFGRIWGSRDSDVYYSQPFKLGWFKLTSNKYSFDNEVTMIAKVPTGLFIGMNGRTKFLAGTVPEQMVQTDAGAGSVRGTLAYCNNMPELGWVLGTAEKDYVDVPVWVTSEGIVVGGANGKLFNITKNKVKMPIPSKGASLYRNLNGVIQYLTSFKTGVKGSGAGFEDSDTYSAFKHGHITTSDKVPRVSGSRSSFTDSATCQVYRGGVEI